MFIKVPFFQETSPSLEKIPSCTSEGYSPTHVFSCTVCEMFRNTYFVDHLRTATFAESQLSRLDYLGELDKFSI